MINYSNTSLFILFYSIKVTFGYQVFINLLIFFFNFCSLKKKKKKIVHFLFKEKGEVKIPRVANFSRWDDPDAGEKKRCTI